MKAIETKAIEVIKPAQSLSVMNRFRAFVRDRRGANMVEYIILVGIVALFAIGAFKMFGGKVVDRVKAQKDTVGNINAAEGQ